MLGLACARTSKISEPLSAAIAAAVASALRIPGMIETTLAVHAAGAGSRTLTTAWAAWCLSTLKPVTLLMALRQYRFAFFCVHHGHVANGICSNPTACWGFGQFRVPSKHAEGFLPCPAEVFPGFSISGLLAPGA